MLKSGLPRLAIKCWDVILVLNDLGLWSYRSLFMKAGIIYGICHLRKKSVFGLTISIWDDDIGQSNVST